MEAALPHPACPLCGAPNECLPAKTGSFEGGCWCQAVEVSREALARVPAEERDRACLCPRCARGERR